MYTYNLQSLDFYFIRFLIFYILYYDIYLIKMIHKKYFVYIYT